MAPIKLDQCAQYITIILLSFIIVSSWVFSILGQSRLEAAAASTSLSTKTNLSNNTITESGQQMKVAASGNNIFVTWLDYTTGPNGDIFFKKSTNGGSTFGSAINLSNNGGDSIQPQIAVSGSIVYVVWDDNTPGNYEIFFIKSNIGKKNISNNVGDSFSPQIVVS